MLRPSAKRVAELPRDREDVMADLEAAATPEQAACAREELHALAHSLWLAGYEPEEMA